MYSEEELDELVASWINGNRSHVVDQIVYCSTAENCADSAHAAAFIASALYAMRGAEEAATFTVILANRCPLSDDRMN